MRTRFPNGTGTSRTISACVLSAVTAVNAAVKSGEGPRSFKTRCLIFIIVAAEMFDRSMGAKPVESEQGVSESLSEVEDSGFVKDTQLLQSYRGCVKTVGEDRRLHTNDRCRVTSR